MDNELEELQARVDRAVDRLESIADGDEAPKPDEIREVIAILEGDEDDAPEA